jgi:cell division protease FtsH
MMSLPEDRMTMSRENYEDKIAVAFGGRAAEEVFYGRLTTAASNDIQQATSIARAMVMLYGMSDSLGLRAFGEQQGSVFLGRDMTYGRNYSEDSATAVDREVSRILDENYTRAKQVIKDNKAKLVELAENLMKVETLDREEFEALMNNETAAPEAETEEATPPPLGWSSPVQSQPSS